LIAFHAGTTTQASTRTECTAHVVMRWVKPVCAKKRRKVGENN